MIIVITIVPLNHNVMSYMELYRVTTHHVTSVTRSIKHCSNSVCLCAYTNTEEVFSVFTGRVSCVHVYVIMMILRDQFSTACWLYWGLIPLSPLVAVAQEEEAAMV